MGKWCTIKQTHRKGGLDVALDPEEFKKRRQQRQQQRQAESKKLKLRLYIAGAVLLLCAIFIIGFAASSNPAPAETPETTVPTEPPAEQVTSEAVTQPEETQPPSTVIHFAAAGDLNVTEQVVTSGDAGYDYTDTFLDVAYLLAEADLSSVNFEGNLCGAPYGSTASAPQSMALALKNAGVDMVQLANSYSINRGISGLLTTIDGIQQTGMEPVGVFKDKAEFNRKKGFSLFEVQGVRVAVVAFTKGMDGTTLPPGNESCVNVLYSDYDSTYQKVDTQRITSVMESVNAAQPDITVALLHWGSEFNDTVSKSQQTICRLLQEQGVDAIIGTHPHYVQQITFDPDTGMLVAYSLGDFIGDAARSGSEYSIVLNLEITKDNLTGVASITGYEYTPLFTVVEEGKPIRVLRIREAVAAYEAGYMDAVNESTYQAMTYALERIEQRVNGE